MSKKIFRGFIALVVVIVLLAAAWVAGWQITGQMNPIKWNKNNNSSKTSNGGNNGALSVPDVDETAGNDCMVITPISNSGIMSLSAMPLTYTDNDGVSVQSDNSYTLTATVEPNDAVNKLVDWQVLWNNSSSSWASGKTVTNYVTVTENQNATNTVTVSCKQAFGEQIVIIASVVGSNVSARCRVDYQQKFLGSDINLSCNESSYPYSWNFTVDNFNPVVDFIQPKSLDDFYWQYGNTSYFSEGSTERYSSLYTLEYSSNRNYVGMGFQFAYTAEYIAALKAAGLTPSVSAETYFNFAGACSFSHILFHCVTEGNDYLWPATSTAYSAFRSSLLSNADKAMIRIKITYVFTDSTSADGYCSVDTIYNVKFSASSLTVTANNLVLDNDNIIF